MFFSSFSTIKHLSLLKFKGGALQKAKAFEERSVDLSATISVYRLKKLCNRWSPMKIQTFRHDRARGRNGISSGSNSLLWRGSISMREYDGLPGLRGSKDDNEWSAVALISCSPVSLSAQTTQRPKLFILLKAP